MLSCQPRPSINTLASKKAIAKILDDRIPRDRLDIMSANRSGDQRQRPGETRLYMATVPFGVPLDFKERLIRPGSGSGEVMQSRAELRRVRIEQHDAALTSVGRCEG